MKVLRDVNFFPKYLKNPIIHSQRRDWLSPESKVFTMGSCFAISVRTALEESGISVYPNYGKVVAKPGQIFDLVKIPVERSMPPHYDTFTMRQEIEAALGLWPDRSKGFYEIRNSLANKKIGSDVVYQDPYRKVNFAVTRPLLEDLADNITEAIAEGIELSDIMIFTLGLTEVWRHKDTGKCLLQSPFAGYGTDADKTEFYQSTFADNYANVRAMLDAIFARYPNKKIIISVSPVRLKMNFSATDVATANVESKAILRAVAGQICREYGDKVLYFPSYEMAMMALGTLTGQGTVFKDNCIEVREDFVASIMHLFKQVITPTQIATSNAEVA